MLSLFKEKKLVFYLDPKPNAYIKKIATPCHSAEKINFPNFFTKIVTIHSKTQPFLFSLGSAGYLNSFQFQKCKICSFDNFINPLLTINYYFLSYRNLEISNTVFFFLITFETKQEVSSAFLQPNKIEEDETYYVDIIVNNKLTQKGVLQ